jgi:hypothetical protein
VCDVVLDSCRQPVSSLPRFRHRNGTGPGDRRNQLDEEHYSNLAQYCQATGKNSRANGRVRVNALLVSASFRPVFGPLNRSSFSCQGSTEPPAVFWVWPQMFPEPLPEL